MSDSKVTIKTARGRGWMTTNGLRDSWEEDDTRNVPVVIVHGLSESEVHEAAALLAKSREVCEWERDGFGILRDCAGESHSTNKHSNGALVTFCPSCGRRVEVKEG